MEICKEENHEIKNIYDYINLVNQESDLLKKSQLELKICQYFVDFVYCKRFFIYKSSVYDISEIYKKRELNCAGTALLLYILINRYLNLEHLITATFGHISNIVRLSANYLAYRDNFVFLIKEQRKNKYIDYDDTKRSVYIINPVQNTILAY